MSEALERVKYGQKLCDERFWLWRLSCRLELRDLKRLNGILRKLSDDDMKRVAAYAEGLAEWSEGDPDGSSKG
jgi:hypothetical protein